MTDAWDYSDPSLGPRSASAAQAGALTSLDENPDEAARAYHLSKDTGIPAEAIHGNLEESETQYKGALVGHLLKNNKYLQDYVNSHPLAGAISNDDYGQLDKISQALGKIGPIGVMQEAVKGFKEHYDTGDLGSYISDKDWEEHPIASTAVTIAGTGFEVGGRILSAGLAGLHAGMVHGLKQFGMEESSAERLARDITGEFERRVQSGEGLHGAQEHVAAAKVAEPYVKAGDVPPVGLDPIIDKLHEDQAKADLKALDEVHKEVQASTTYERAPELTKAFIQQHIGQAKIGITADEVAKLYGEKQPHPEDGILGFVPDLASQLKVALASGGDVEVPLADWLAHVDPEVAKELHDHLRLRKGGMTLEETKNISALEDKQAEVAKPKTPFQDIMNEVKEVGFEGKVQVQLSLFPDDIKLLRENGVEVTDDGIISRIGLNKISGLANKERKTLEESKVISQQLMVEAKHASPHDFDAFSMDKIGTGEGAQSYGHGLYFSESEGVHKQYLEGFGPEAQSYRVRIHADKEHFLDWDKPLSEQDPQVQQALERLKGKLNLDPALFEEGNRASTGQHFNLDISQALRESDVNMSPKQLEAEVSKVLHGEGIPGIKYLDQGSRRPNTTDLQERLKATESDLAYAKAHPEGFNKDIGRITNSLEQRINSLKEEIRTLPERQSHNFVLFDDSLIEITHKNDQAVASVRKAAGLETLTDRFLEQAQDEAALAEAGAEKVQIGDVTAWMQRHLEGKRAEIAEAINAEGKKLGLKGVAIGGADKLAVEGAGEVRGTYTQFDNQAPLILYAITSDDPIGYFRHEAIHHLRQMGFFKEGEWDTLVAKAMDEDWIKKHDIEERYPDLDKEGKLEEAVAEEFRNRTGEFEAAGRLKKFLDAIKAAIKRILGYELDANELFGQVEKGEIGSRTGVKPIDPRTFDQKLAKGPKQPELPGVTRQEDLSTFKPSAVGLTGRQMQKVMDLIAELNKEDQAYQQKKIEKLERAKQTTEWKEHEAEIRDEVENDLASRPDIALSNFLRSGLLYGESTGRRPRIDPRQLTPEQRAAFPEKYTRRDGMAPEDIANLFGYPSVDAMVAGIAKLEGDMATAGETRLGEFTRKLAVAETDRRMVEKYGDLEENILREAQEHVVSPTQMDLLHEETVALGMQNGWEMPFTKEEVKAGTKEAFGEMPSGGVSMEKFLKDSGKAGKLAQLALLEGNATEFFKQRQRQEYALRYADEAKRFAKEQERFERTAKRFSSREVAGVLPEYTNFVHDILGRVSRPVKRSVQDLADAIDRSGYKDVNAFVESKEAGLREVPVADFLLDPSFRKPIGEMSVNEYRAVADSIKTLVHNGRNELKIIREGEAFDLQEVKDGMREQLETFPEKEISVTSEAGKGFVYASKTAWAALLQIEALFRRWDRGDRNGLFTKYISRPLADASNNYAALEKKYGNKLRDLKDGVKLSERVDNTIFREPTAGGYGELMTFNRGNLRAVLRYVSRPQALEKLAKGYGLRPEQIMDWLNQNAKKEDWDWAQKMGDTVFEEVFKEASRLYERTSGVAPEKSDIAPVQTPHGTYPGWYYPIDYDPRFPGSSKKLMGGDPLQQAGYVRATTPAGYTKKVSGYNAPLNLDIASTAEHLRGMLHDLAYREAVIEASKVFYDSSFQRTVNKHYGQQYQKLLIPYLRDVANVANFNSEAQAVGSRVSEFMRQNIIGALIGFNPGTVMKHGATAWVNSMNQVGGVRFLAAVKDMFQKDEATGERNWTFALRESEELARRHRNYIETLRGSESEALGETSWREMMLRGGAWTVSKADLASAVPTWLAEYRHSMEDGRTHGEAVGDGNAAVRQAHGSSVITNRPAAMRGGQAAQWMTSLYGFFSHMLNKQYEMMWRSREMFGKFDEGEYAKAAADLPRITNMFFAYVAFPALIEELVTPMTNDEHESMLSWTGKTLAKGVSSSWPIIRDLAHAALSINNTEPSVGLFTTAAKTAIDVIRDMKDVKHKFSKEQAGKTLQHGITAFGALTGLANQQEGRVAHFMYNMYTGQERPKGPWQFLVGLRYGQTKGHSKSFAEYMNSMIGGRR